jgi:hypothetical protein
MAIGLIASWSALLQWSSAMTGCQHVTHACLEIALMMTPDGTIVMTIGTSAR